MIRVFAGLTDEIVRTPGRRSGVTADAIQKRRPLFYSGRGVCVIAVYASEDRLLQANEICRPNLW